MSRPGPQGHQQRLSSQVSCAFVTKWSTKTLVSVSRLDHKIVFIIICTDKYLIVRSVGRDTKINVAISVGYITVVSARQCAVALVLRVHATFGDSDGAACDICGSRPADNPYQTLHLQFGFGDLHPNSKPSKSFDKFRQLYVARFEHTERLGLLYVY